MTDQRPGQHPHQQYELRHEVHVPVAPQAAFDAFLQLDQIKPREHNLLAVPIAQTTVDPRAGGGIVDHGIDGSQCQWGTVLAYDPPHRFVFSWNIGPDWQTTTDPDHASEVEVTFTPTTGPTSGAATGSDATVGTQVVLVHRHLERHGVGWEAVGAGVDSPEGWPLYLQRLSGVIADAGDAASSPDPHDNGAGAERVGDRG